MRPKDYLPAWERDFWDTLMEDQGVFVPPREPPRTGKSRMGGYVSPYAVGDVLVGEIVEDEQPCITA